MNWLSLPDQIIGTCYMAIPVALVFSAASRKKIMGRGWADPGNLLLLLFAGFIVACGVGHEIDAYFSLANSCGAMTIVKRSSSWITAIMSLITVFAVVPSLPYYVAALMRPFDAERMRQRIRELERKLAPEEAVSRFDADLVAIEAAKPRMIVSVWHLIGWGAVLMFSWTAITLYVIRRLLQH